MNYKARYEELLLQVRELSSLFEQLEPNKTRLEKLFLESVAHCLQLGEDLTATFKDTVSLPASPENVQSLIAQADSLIESKARETETRLIVINTLIEKLNRTEYHHRIARFRDAGELTRCAAIECLRSIVNDQAFCELVCGDCAVERDLFEDWCNLSENDHERECTAWPPELKPISELRVIVNDLKFVKEHAVAQVPGAILDTSDTRGHLDAENTDPIQPETLDGEKATDAELPQIDKPPQHSSPKQPASTESRRGDKRLIFQRGLLEGVVPAPKPNTLEIDIVIRNGPNGEPSIELALDDLSLETVERESTSSESASDTNIGVNGQRSEQSAIQDTVVATAHTTDRTEVQDSPQALKDSAVESLTSIVSDSPEIDPQPATSDNQTLSSQSTAPAELATAEAAEHTVPASTPLQVNEAAWAALAQERHSLAYCILKAAESHKSLGELRLPPELASVALLSSLTMATSTAINEQLRHDFGQLNAQIGSMPDTFKLPAQLLTMSCALQPALVAPFTDAGTSLMSTQIPVGGVRSFVELCRAVGTFSQQHVQVDPSVLTGVCAHADWQAQMLQLKLQLKEWWQSERCAKVIYAHTTNVWQNWLQESGIVGAFLGDVTSEEFDSDHSLSDFLVEWSDDREIDKRCRATDSDLRGAGARRRPIDGRALHALRQKVSMLRDLLNAIRQKLAARPDSESSTTYELVKHCRVKVLQELDPALKELQALECKPFQPTAVQSATKLAIQNLTNLRSLFTEPKLLQPPTEQVLDLLLSDLVLAPGVDYSLGEKRSFRLEELEKLVQAALNPLSEQEAFDLQTKQKNHAATERIIQKLTRRNEHVDALSDLANKRQEALESDRIKIKAEIEVTQQEIDKSVCFDLVNEADRLRLTADVESMRTLVDDETNFSPTVAALKKIKSELEKLRESRLRDVRARYESLDKNLVRQQDLEAIQRTLDSGDFPTADEYISLVRDGELLDLTHTEDFDEFSEFFRVFLPETTRYLKEHSTEQPAEWVRQLDQRKAQVFGRDFREDGRAKFARTILEEWRCVQRIKANDSKRTMHLQALFTAFGLEVKPIATIASGNRWLLEKLESAPIANSSICAIPEFGSKANGRYQILSIDDQCSDSDIDKIIADASLKHGVGDGPLFVLFCGRLDEARRRKIARDGWGKNTFLLIDEYLVMYLATRPDGTLRSLFRCTLPFTFVQPYSITASYVPNEMFVGRRDEFKGILSQEGTNLVFGGRQLGKSVLLREVERRSHAPEKGIIVRWVDLKNRGIGTHEPASELWTVVADVLLQAGVLKQAMRNHLTIQANIKQWLEESENRRILLLLDEADEFFNQDSQQTENSRAGFPVVSQFKGLMDDTNRRFKVVFAGLHNVQRAAKDSNTPIAHLGRPINIGPLLDNGEWKNARELIEIPLRQMGYEFESDNIVTRILSHTNFYPSLIQIFCRHLLLSFQKRSNSVVDFKNGPRHRIRLEDIDRIYQSSELQDEIRSRFELTLNLDERYRLIALLIALQTIEMREVGQQLRGLTLQEIRTESLSFWAEGFKQNSTFDGFEILLDEMVGLGVLRRDPDGSYALRSANVLNLMGTKKRIEERLVDVASSAPPAEYTASSFRRSLMSDSVHRSPLTSQQEGRLLARSNGVCVLVGSRLAQVDTVGSALNSLERSDVNVITYPDSLSNTVGFQTWLDKAYQRQSGLTIVLIPFDSDWSSSDVVTASKLLSRKQAATKNFMRVIFLADPPHLWNADLELNSSDRIELFQLQPWKNTMLDRWLDDNNFNRDKSSVDSLMESTGGWGYLIQDLVRRCSDRKHAWHVELANLEDRWRKETIEHDILQMPAEAEHFLRTWAQFGNEESGVDHELLSEIAPADKLSKLVSWAEQLSYVEPTEEGHWRINKFVYKVLAAKS